MASCCILLDTGRVKVTSRAVRVVDEAGATAWEQFDVTSAVARHVTRTGGGGRKAVGFLRLKVTLRGCAETERSRRHLVFGEDLCNEVSVRELRHRHHPVLNVFTTDRPRSVKSSHVFHRLTWLI